MTTQIKIVGLGGSASRRSSSTLAIENVLAGARNAGAAVVSMDVQTLALPMYEYGPTPSEVEPLVDAVRSAHGMVWCSPLYHGSISGAFKNAIDWLQLLSNDDPPYLSGKVIALVATAGGDQALQAINTMEFIVRALRGWTLPLTAPISRADAAFDEQGVPHDQRLGERLYTIGHELVQAAQTLAK
ncbi:MAG: NAD(P)H-dependent oxidoreductase [Proteobacteria bacterium]|nr:NAD(P)H-dependent oxidoreductase [Pseudomonadota bacterium]